MARPFRFTVILLLAAIATALAAVGGWRYARASAPVNGPILLISIDTLRADHLPAYGYRKVKTPAIDALAADGTVFERAYAHAPQTLPAHASILSGRLPFETGVRDDVGFALKADERTLPQMLSERGYATAGIVSSFALRKETGIGRGFELFDGDMPIPIGGTPLTAVRRDGGESEAIAERWLDRQRSRRLFLFLHLFEPHAPYAPPIRYARYAPYDGTIAYADEIVGRLIRYLKSHQLYDQSTIVLLSDHGEGLGDHGEQEHGLFLYDEVVHVPLVIKLAAGAGAGRRIADLVQQIDLAPTILDLARAPIPGNLRGRSLKALLDGSGPLRPAAVYSEALLGRYHFGWSGIWSLTDQRYRFVKAPREELYDRDRDPRDTDNRAERQPGVRRAMRAALDRMVAGAPDIPPALPVREDERERLAALGSVSAHVPTLNPEEEPADPKDRVALLEAYRAGAALVASDRLIPAIDLFQRLAREHTAAADPWRQLADVLLRAGRGDQAARAYERSAALAPDRPDALLAAADALYRVGRLDEARRNADAALTLVRGEPGRDELAARELLAKIAVARRDFDAAREHAAAGPPGDTAAPLVTFVDGLIAHAQRQYDEALDRLRAAEGAAATRHVALGEVHFYLADTLAHLERWDEAAAEYLAELDISPRNLRARAGLATAYLTAGRPEDAEHALVDLITIAHTPEGYAVAARVWTAAFEFRRADALRSEARRLFHGDPTLTVLAQAR